MFYLHFVDFRIHFNNLCDYLGNQIIYLCRKTIDTNILLDTEVNIIQDEIHKCLQCCELFIAEYTEVMIKCFFFFLIFINHAHLL